MVLSLLLGPQAAQAQAFPCAPTATAGTVTVCATSGTTDRQTGLSGLQVFEGDTVGIAVRAHGLTAGSLSVTLSVIGNSGNDINVSPGLTFTLTSSNPEVTRNFVVTDDATKESAETISFSVLDSDIVETATTPATFTRGTPGAYSFSILASDARTITVTGPSTLTETDTDAESGNYTITRTGDAFQSPTTVTWRITHGTTTNSDFIATSGTVRFSATDTTQTFRIAVVGDNIGEADKTFTVQVSVRDPLFGGGTSYGTAHSTTLNDDDRYTLNVEEGFGRLETPTGDFFGVNEGADENRRRIRIRYSADDGSSALAAEATVTATIVGEAPGITTTNAGYPAGLTSERAATATGSGADFASDTFTCTIPANTAHRAIVLCAMPAITDDMVSERVEHFTVELSGSGGAGVTYGAKRRLFIHASDPINLRVDQAAYTVEEGNPVTVRVHITAEAGTTIYDDDGTLEQFRLLFDDGDATNPSYRLEWPPSGQFTSLIDPDNVWERAVGMRHTDVEISTPEDSNVEADEVQTWRLRGFHDLPISWVITGGDTGNDGTFTVTVTDDDPVRWTVRARGGGTSAQDVNEGAAAIASPTTADTSTAHADTMYFRFTTYEDGTLPNARGETTVTYCLAGTATGATAAAIAADSSLAYDYTYPTGYDPDSTTAAHADYSGSCETGRGSFTIAAGTSVIYRLPVTLNDDNLNEGDETITAQVVNVVEAGSLSTVDAHATNSIATRTIKDNDGISISVANVGTDADPTTDGFQVWEGRDAVFRITISKPGASAVSAACTIGGDLRTSDIEGGQAAIPACRVNLAAGETSGEIRIPLAEDADTGSEDVSVGIDPSGHTAPGSIGRSTVTAEQSALQKVITRTTARTLRLTRFTDSTYTSEASDTALREDTGALYFAAAFAGLSDTNFTSDTAVTWTVTPAATAGTAAADFSAVTGSIMYPATGCGGTTPPAACRFTVTVTDDEVNEATEGFSVALSVANEVADGGTEFGTGSGDLTLSDNDAISVSIANRGTDADSDNTNGFQVREGDDAVFRITLDHASAADAMVPFTVAGLEEADVTGGLSAITSSPLTITAGQTTADITIPLAEDDETGAEEMSEAMTVTLGTDYTAAGTIARSTTSSEQSATQNIIPRSAHIFTLDSPMLTIAETDADAATTYTLARTGPAITGAGIRVTWTVTNGSTTDADFSDDSEPGGVVAFTGSQTSGTFEVGIEGDDLNEANETFSIAFSIAAADQAVVTANGEASLPADHRVTITDDDPIVITVTAAATTVSEGGNATFRVSLSAEHTNDIVISYGQFVDSTTATDDVDATTSGVGSDLGELSNSALVEFYEGDTPYTGNRFTTSINIPIIADNLNESAETFVIDTSAASITGGHGPVTIASGSETTVFTIAASDPMTASIAAGAATVTEGQSAEFTVTLDGASAGSVTTVSVPYSVALTGPGYSLADVGGSPRTLTIAAGATEGTITIPLPLNTLLNDMSPDQTITVTLTADDAGTAGTDEGPTTGAGGGEVTRTTTTAGQSAQTAVDFVTGAHSFTFTNPVMRITEGTPTTTYTVTRTGPDITGTGITVTWAYAAGTPAPVAADFMGGNLPAGGTLEFTGTETTETFTITLAEDTLNEPDEQFTLTLSIAAGAHTTAADAEGGASLPDALTVTIADDDPVTVAITRASGSGSVSESSGNVSFTVTVAGGTRAAGVNTIVPFSVGGDAAITAGDYDITAPTPAPDGAATAHSITIASGDSTGTITVAIIDDDLNESQEQLTVTGAAAGATGLRLSGGGGGVQYTSGGNTAGVPIDDNDDITITIANAGTDADDDNTNGFQVEEGSDATFTVTLDHTVAAGSVVVMYEVGGAVEAADYTDAGGGSLTIPAGRLEGTITVSINEDDDTDASEDITVTLSPGTAGIHFAFGGIMRHANAAQHAATQSIIPRQADHRFTLTSPASSIAETDADAATTYTLARTGPTLTGAGIRVTWTVTNGSTADADFSGDSEPSGVVAFTGSETSGTFEVGIKGDNLNEPNETFSIAFSIAAADQAAVTANGDARLPADHRVTVTDDDPIVITATATALTVSEGGMAQVEYTFSAIHTNNIDIVYPSEHVGNTAATNDVDATSSSAASGADVGEMSSTGEVYFTVGFPTDDDSLRIAIINDNLNEAAETFVVDHSAATFFGGHGPVTFADSSQTTVFTIAASDPMTASIAADDATLNEGQSAAFTVTLAGASAGSVTTVSVPYSVALTGSGYTLAEVGGSPRTLTIAAGATEGTITIPLPLSATLGDSDPDQTVTVTLTGDDLATPLTDEGPTTAAGGGEVTRTTTPAGQSAQTRVNFVDGAHSFAFTNPVTRITEGGGGTAITYTVTRTGPDITGTGITVTWAYAAGTPAPAAADFMGGNLPAGGTLEFTGSGTTDTFTITLANDTLNEPDKQFTLALSIASAHQTAADAEGGASVPDAITVTIADDDPVTVAITRASGSGSVSESSGNVSFTVTVAGGTRAAGVSTIVPFSVGGAAAVTADDYDITAPTPAPGAAATTHIVTIAHGSTTATITVALFDDDLNEFQEPLTVTGAAPGATGLRLSGGATGAVQYTVGGRAAIAPIDDNDDITITIANAAGTDSHTDSGHQVDEGTDAVFTVTLDHTIAPGGTSSGNVGVRYTVGGDVEPEDYTDAGNGRINIPAGQLTGTIRIAILEDADTDTAEAITVTLDAMGHIATGAIMRSATPSERSATQSIIPRQAAHRFTLTSPASSIAETDDDANTRFTVTRTGPDIIVDHEITLTYTVTLGSAAAADFSGDAAPTGMVTFATTDTSQTFDIGIAGDNLNEPDETFTVTFSIASTFHQSFVDDNGGARLPADHAVTLTDDDPIAVTVTATALTVEEGENAVVNLDLGAIPSRDVTVGYAIGSTTAATDVDAAAADYTDTNGGSVTISAAGGVATGAITIGLTADNLNESAETFTVTITAADLDGEYGTATVASGGGLIFTIEASDPMTASIARAAGTAATVNEGQSAQFTVTLRGATAGSAAAVMVPYSVAAGGTGYDPTDSGGGRLTIAAGQTEGTITIAMPTTATLGMGDPERTVTVTLTADNTATTATDEGPTTGTGGGAVTRTDMTARQSAEVAVNFIDGARTLAVTGAATIAEKDGPAATSTNLATVTYTITLTGMAFTASTPVHWAVTHGGTSDADFRGAPGALAGTVTFADSDGDGSTRQFAIAVAPDDLNEADEIFTVQVRVDNPAADSGTAYGRPASTTIADDDPVTVAITRASGSGPVSEGSGTLDFTVTLAGGTRATGVNVMLPFGVSGLDRSDYLLTSPGRGSLSIGPNSPTATISLRLTDDNLNEAQETLTMTGAPVGDGGLRLSGGGGAVQYTLGGDTVSVPIDDNDDITITIANAAGADSHADSGHQVDEGTDAEFTVTLDHTVAAGNTVGVRYSVGGAVEAADYMDAGNGMLTIPAGQLTGTIRIAILEDADTEAAEAITVTLAATGHTATGAIARSATPDQHSATQSIIPRQAAHRITLAAASTTVAEGAAAVFTVTRIGAALTTPIAITWTVADAATGGDVTAADFGAVFPTDSVMFSGGETEKTFTVRPAADSLSEMSESFAVALSATDAVLASNGRILLGGAVTVTIADNDAIDITIGGPRRIGEQRTVAFPVRLSAAPSEPLTVNWAVAAAMPGGGSVAAAAGDFADGRFPSGTLTFDEGVTEREIVLRTSAGVPGADGSADNSPDRVFTLTLRMPSGGGGGTNPSAPPAAVVTIAEENLEAVMAVNQAVLPEVTRAVVGRQMSVIAERAGQAGGVLGNLPRFNLNGQSSLAGMAAANARALADDSLDMKHLLKDMDFVMPLGAAEGRGAAGATAFWGGSEYRDFSGEEGGADWDGELLSMHLGVDRRIGGGWLAGVMVSHSQAQSDYKQVTDGRTSRGEYELDLTGISPYLNRRWAGGEAWVSATYGSGQVETTPDGEAVLENDVSLQGLGAGGSRVLRRAGERQLSVRADGFLARTEIDGEDGGLTEDLEVDTHRVRVAMELSYGRALSGDARLTRSLDLGARHDGGDGRTGANMELGGQLRYHDAGRGLTVQWRVSTLLAHDSDNRDWGMSGLLRLAPGGDGQGLSLSLTPSYGDAATNPQALWDGVAAGQSPADRQAHLAAEVGYGMPAVMNAGMLTPYSALRFGETGRDYRLGVKWAADRRLDLDLSARRTAADRVFSLQGRMRF